ncbi:MAG: tRNA (adenosine(37)-N6)-threonylcarbamoyltransferase complex ATPase subunit type 1 TsaE [Planctomycetes bacterium]|nr:tRNA (adenosine(37)-N6)-threonylcarbamoyltransferase complex ATPase subunit type 1 TsaE [Planctomycetota bacterium]
MHEYAGRLRLYHADLYRLMDPRELIALGYEEWCDDDSVVVIEWADRFRSTLGDDVLWVELRPTGEASRSVIFEAQGEPARDCLDRLRAALR